MPLVEAVLMYRVDSPDSEPRMIAVGSTSAPKLLRVLRNQLMEDAEQEVRFWRGLDPGLEKMKSADSRRLAVVLDFLIPVSRRSRHPQM